MGGIPEPHGPGYQVCGICHGVVAEEASFAGVSCSNAACRITLAREASLNAQTQDFSTHTYYIGRAKPRSSFVRTKNTDMGTHGSFLRQIHSLGGHGGHGDGTAGDGGQGLSSDRTGRGYHATKNVRGPPGPNDGFGTPAGATARGTPRACCFYGRRRMCKHEASQTDSTIAPPPKPAVFSIERFMAARHEE